MTKRIALAITSGILLAASFPPFDLGLLAFVALIPLLFAMEGAGARKGFFLGLVSGFAFFLSTVYWVVNSMFFYGGLTLSTSVPAMLLLVFYLSLYFGLFGLLFQASSGLGGMPRLFLAPFFWTAVEYLRGNLFTGFPWVNLGYALVPYPLLIQTADIAGVWGISFTVTLVNTGIFLYTRSILRGAPRPRKELAVTAALLLSVISYGIVRTEQVESAVSSWRQVKTSIAQGNIDQGVKWDASYQMTTLDIYRDLTMKADGELTVWPETAVPFYLGEDKVGTGLVGDVAKKSGGYLLTGSPSYRYNPGTGRVEYFNSVFLFNPEGAITGSYDKVHLVPFGEYVPGLVKKILPFIRKLTAGVGDFSSGRGTYPLDSGGTLVGPVICYEAIFPELSRGHIENGAGLIVNLTNDAWFGRTSAPYQHFSMAVARAVENRVYLVRAANTGISGIVDPAGRVVARTGLFEEAVITGSVGIKEGLRTFYSAYGDVFAYLSLLVSGAFISTRIFKSRRRGKNV